MTKLKLIFFIASCIISFYAGAFLGKPKQLIGLKKVGEISKGEMFILFLAFLAIFQITALNFQVINQRQEIKRLKNQPKMVIYEVKDTGGVIDHIGTITAKNVIEGRYMVTVSGYGNFLVNKEQYDSLKIGDEIPEFLKRKEN